MNIREYLKRSRLITDGAMGTYYEKKYGEDGGFAEKANTSAPQRIVETHLEYLRAGARLLRTNTFASNTLFFDDINQVKENIRAGYVAAKQAAAQYRQETGEQDIYIAADIGPVFDIDGEQAGQALEEYQAVCDAFLSCGADIFIFETQTEFKKLPEITAYIKQKNPEAFIITQFAFDKSGYTRAGISISRMINMAAACESLDAYGFNCGVGASHLFRLLKHIQFPNEKYLTALPNAGYPHLLRGRTLYADNEAYFVKMTKQIAELGVDILGGCCGTTPDYIRNMAAALHDTKRAGKHIQKAESPGEKQTLNRAELSSGHDANAFIRKLRRGEKVMIVELDPPFKNDITKVMEGAELLRDAGADVITLSDSPMARARMDAGALAAKIEREVQIPVMPHLCCRDKNLIGLRAAVMGDYMNGIRQMLFVTGDPVERDARGQITGVFDVNSIKLMQYVHEMNVELYEDEPLIYGGALNYHGANPDAIVRRMELKVQAGCSYFLTQPIYSDEDIARIRYMKEHVDTKIMCGIMPLVSYKNMMFIHNEMPGIHIPEEIQNSYTPQMSREEAAQTAVGISVKIVEKLSDLADGYYFITPFNRAGLICDIMKHVK